MIVPDNQSGADATAHDPAHTLYYFPFSLYSLIVRLALELGYSVDPESSPPVKLRLLDINEQENLSEDYLRISPNGQVSNEERGLGLDVICPVPQAQGDLALHMKVG